MTREGIQAVIHDEEFDPLLADAPADLLRVVGWHDESSSSRSRSPSWRDCPPQLTRPVHRGRQVILTSGTTGTPKGASRSVEGLEPAAAFLSGIPLKSRETTVIAAPLFHAWGLAHLGLGLLLSSTVVLSRRFDPEQVLALVERASGQRARRRPGDDAADARASGGDPQALRHLVAERRGGQRFRAAGGAVEPVHGRVRRRRLQPLRLDRGGVRDGRLARRICARRRAPPDGCCWARRSSSSTRRRPGGARGRGRAASSSAIRLLFTGYTGGEDKDRLGDLVASGDLGRFDAQGRLFIEGRDDEMIVSGGENVFPAEVEELLSKHPAVREAAVVGVADEKMGQRLVAYVVKGSEGRSRAPRRVEGAGEGQAGPPQGAARRAISSTNCRATRPARSSSASSGRRTDGRRRLEALEARRQRRIARRQPQRLRGQARPATAPTAAAPRRGSRRRRARRRAPAVRAAGAGARRRGHRDPEPRRPRPPTPRAFSRRAMRLAPAAGELARRELLDRLAAALDELVDEARGRALRSRWTSAVPTP